MIAIKMSLNLNLTKLPIYFLLIILLFVMIKNSLIDDVNDNDNTLEPNSSSFSPFSSSSSSFSSSYEFQSKNDHDSYPNFDLFENDIDFRSKLCKIICSKDPGEGGTYCNCDRYPLYPSF